MILTRKLFGYLHRVFDVEAHEVPAIRLTCAGGMTWSVADGVFTATLPGPVEVEVDLSLYTQGGFVLWLAQQPGIDIDWSDLSLAPLSALALIDAVGAGTAVTLSALTAPQFAYMDAVALELHRARRQIEAMPGWRSVMPRRQEP